MPTFKSIETIYADFVKSLKPESREKWGRVKVELWRDTLIMLAEDEETRAYIEPKIDGNLIRELSMGLETGIRQIAVKVGGQPSAETVVSTPRPAPSDEIQETDWRGMYREAVAELRTAEARLAEAEARIAALERELRFERDWKQVNPAKHEPVQSNERVVVIDRAHLASLIPTMTPRAAMTLFTMLTMIGPDGQLQIEPGVISVLCGYKVQKSLNYLMDGCVDIGRVGQGFLVNCPLGTEKEAVLSAGDKNSLPYIYEYDDEYKKDSFGESSSYGETPEAEVIRQRVKFLDQIGFHWKQNWKRIADKVAAVSAEQWEELERTIYAGRAKGLKNPAGMVWDTLNAAMAS